MYISHICIYILIIKFYKFYLAELSGFRVRPFKVSGGSPRPPPEQTPVVTSKDSSTLNNNNSKQYLYNNHIIYIYIYPRIS